MNSTAAIKSFTANTAVPRAQVPTLRGNEVGLCTRRKSFVSSDEHLGATPPTAWEFAARNDRLDPFEDLGGNTAKPWPKRVSFCGRAIVPCTSASRRNKIAKVRRENPGFASSFTPECKFEVAQAADEIGSTEGIISRDQSCAAGSKWAVARNHMVNRLSKELKDRQGDVA